MARFELSLSPTYVPNWGLTEAIRELFQNALDQEITNSENKMSYLRTPDKFYISSKESVLEKSSLLLGCSSKATDKTTIGKFGEGYKLALLVLTRLNYKVIIYNYAAKEVWTPKIIKSRRYNSDLLVVDVKKHIFSSVPDSNLTFEIIGITSEDFELIKQYNLFMQEGYTKLNTDKGEILLDSRHKGMLFVNGLYINTVEEQISWKGYNFVPKVINLDRDRVLVDSFNLNWNTSEAWAKVNDTNMCQELILANAPDVRFLDSFLNHQTIELSEEVFDGFQSIHGLDAIPISSQDELEEAKQRYPKLNPVIVKQTVASIINRSPAIISLKSETEVVVEEKSAKEQIQNLVEKYFDSLEADFIEELNIILENLKD